MTHEQKHLRLPKELIEKIEGSKQTKYFNDFTSKVTRLLEIALEHEKPPDQQEQRKQHRDDPPNQERKKVPGRRKVS